MWLAIVTHRGARPWRARLFHPQGGPKPNPEALTLTPNGRFIRKVAQKKASEERLQQLRLEEANTAPDDPIFGSVCTRSALTPLLGPQP